MKYREMDIDFIHGVNGMEEFWVFIGVMTVLVVSLAVVASRK